MYNTCDVSLYTYTSILLMWIWSLFYLIFASIVPGHLSICLRRQLGQLASTWHKAVGGSSNKNNNNSVRAHLQVAPNTKLFCRKF